MRQNKEIEARDKAKTKKEGLDPVGQEDADIDNDGDTDSSDKYLHKRRKAISKPSRQRRRLLKKKQRSVAATSRLSLPRQPRESMLTLMVTWTPTIPSQKKWVSMFPVLVARN